MSRNYLNCQRRGLPVFARWAEWGQVSLFLYFLFHALIFCSSIISFSLPLYLRPYRFIRSAVVACWSPKSIMEVTHWVNLLFFCFISHLFVYYSLFFLHSFIFFFLFFILLFLPSPPLLFKTLRGPILWGANDSSGHSQPKAYQVSVIFLSNNFYLHFKLRFLVEYAWKPHISSIYVFVQVALGHLQTALN